MEKFTIWLDPDVAEEVEQIKADERRQSTSNTIAALVGEALEHRKERAKRERKTA